MKVNKVNKKLGYTLTPDYLHPGPKVKGKIKINKTPKIFIGKEMLKPFKFEKESKMKNLTIEQSLDYARTINMLYVNKVITRTECRNSLKKINLFNFSDYMSGNNFKNKK